MLTSAFPVISMRPIFSANRLHKPVHFLCTKFCCQNGLMFAQLKTGTPTIEL